MKALYTLLKILAAAMLCGTAAHAQPANILLIIADDLGSDSFPLTADPGATVPPMPNISALKNSGVLFAQAYAQPVCSPTRACMLTGRSAFRTGVGMQLENATTPALQASEFTLPEAFAANSGLGYSLAMFGKWHLNVGAGSNDTPRTIGGWPYFSGTISGALPDYFAWTKVTNNVSSAVTTYATTETINDTISWIGTQGTAPWFAWVALNAPHAPFHQPPLDLHSYDAAPATNRNYYEAMCEAMDTEVGRLLAAVNLAETTVIFIGDNGTPGTVIQTPYNNAHSKGTLYSGGTHVPLIIAGAGITSPNRTCSIPVHCVDLYATILELAGIDIAGTQPSGQVLDSRSLLPILQDSPSASGRTAFMETFGPTLTDGESGAAIMDSAGYRLIQFYDGHEEFYRTSTDPNETATLLGSGSLTTTDQAAYAALKLQITQAQGISVPNEPLLATWFTKNSGRFARLYPTLADMNAGNAVTTWSRGTGVQSSPVYAGVHQIDYSADWVYVHSTGLPSHVMGPWYLNAAKTNLFPNYPSNTATTFRFPRTPSIPGSKTLFGGGTVGFFVDGVSVFDIRDAFSWNGTTDVNGAGIWNRDAWVNEGVTFDNAGAHQAGNNHHYHANPIALRYLLGDHVEFNPTTNVYSESATPVTRHSPILGWVRDGLPIYGPYGYSEPMNASSGVRRMVSGFLLRDGQNGTDDLTATGRTSIPQWAVRAYGASAQAGPPVSATYPLGRYLEDNLYRGDLGQTFGVDFDLNEYNVRYCVTPEFPSGTWAYFLCIAADGTPQFPYQVGRSYFGSPSGGAVSTIDETVATAFVGGPFSSDAPTDPTVSGTDVSVHWKAVEGATYAVEASGNLSNWTTIATGVVAAGDDSASITETGAAQPPTTGRFYKITRTAQPSYDATGFAGTVASDPPTIGGGPNTVTPNSASAGSTVAVIIELDATITPNLPPANIPVFSVTISGAGVTASNFTRPSQTIVQATFTVDVGAASGARNVSVRFNNAGGVQRTINGAFTVN